MLPLCCLFVMDATSILGRERERLEDRERESVCVCERERERGREGERERVVCEGAFKPGSRSRNVFFSSKCIIIVSWCGRRNAKKWQERQRKEATVTERKREREKETVKDDRMRERESGRKGNKERRRIGNSVCLCVGVRAWEREIGENEGEATVCMSERVRHTHSQRERERMFQDLHLISSTCFCKNLKASKELFHFEKTFFWFCSKLIPEG